MTSREAPRLVSVVLPVLDRAEVLGGTLAALEAQDHEGDFEVVVADNGSTDGTRELAERWAAAGPRRRVVDASHRRGPSAARNAGSATATGDFLAFCDAGNVPATDWLRHLAAAAADADIVAGRLSVVELNGALPRAWYAGPPPDRPMTALGFLPFASGCNLGIWAEALEQLGGFDEEFRAGEDIDLSWRAQLAGRRLGFAHDALVHRRYRSDIVALARQHYGYGLGNAQLYRRFRGHGARRPPPGTLARQWAWLTVNAYAAARDGGRRGVWVRRMALHCGQLAGSARSRVVFP